MTAKKTTVLIADDDVQIVRAVTRSLQMEGYAVLEALDGEQALKHIEVGIPDVLLLDITMPKVDGIAVCEHVREFSSVPIIMLTARSQDTDKVRGLDAGADDYLSKPFSLDELFARIRAVLRRGTLSHVEAEAPLKAKIQIGDLRIDFTNQELYMADRPIVVTPVEYRIVTYLAQHRGRLISQSLLLEHVWGQGYSGEVHLLQVAMSRLRRKIEPDPHNPRYILTKTGFGYLMPAQPTDDGPIGAGLSSGDMYEGRA